MSGVLIAIIAVALGIWGLLNRAAYQRHIRRVAEIEQRLSLRMACSAQARLQAAQA